MSRPKRQRASSNHHNADEHGDGHGLDDERVPMNPSLMTERQQLAFLLRKTAQEASGSDSLQSSESSGEDELIQSFAKGARRISRGSGNTKSSPRSNGSANNGGNASLGEGVVIYRGRGRPPKNAIKLPRGQHYADSKATSSPKHMATVAAGTTEEVERRRNGNERSVNPDESHPRNAKKLKVTTRSPEDRSEAPKNEKSSPSSSSDVLHMDTFESDGSSHGGDCWSLRCALCCHNSGGCEAPSASDALFLCPSCDQKYPTQRALGRV